LGKITIKGAIQVSGHSLKLHFYMFERSQAKNNNLDCHNFLEYILLIANFTCSKLDTNQKCFCMFKAFKPRKWIVPIFFKRPFFSTKCAPFFLKVGKDFNPMIRLAK